MNKNNSSHRYLNTILIVIVLCVVSIGGYAVNYKFQELDVQDQVRSEIAQLAADEGYRSCAYLDSLGKATIGFGHLLTKDDALYNKRKVSGKLCINPIDAVEQLRADYDYASNAVAVHYSWADEDVKLVLTNMTFQLGVEGLSKFTKTLVYLRKEEYDLAASELLNSIWANQTPNRAGRLAGRIMALK